jgi:hypothetical protein
VSGADADLEQFLEVLGKLMSRHLAPGEPMGGSERVVALERALAEADVLGLALETVDMDGARRWLAAVVRTVAHSSPSLALVLAGRYAAHRAVRAALGESAPIAGATAGVVAHLDVDDPASVGAARATVPWLFDPELTVLLDAGGAGGVLVGGEATATEPSPKRTGLADASLYTVRVVGEPIRTLDPELASAAVGELTLLTAAASIGVAEAALAASSAYAAQRRQFGSSLLSFAGIRAMLVEMRLRVSAVSALLERALDDGTAESCLELAATAGRAAVEVAVDAIQVHGGYGYIDEYPVAGLLRDALSLRARIPRRSSVARLGARFQHHLEGSTS